MTTLVTKNSVTAASAPTISDIIQGELAINLTDGYIFSRDEANNIIEFGIIKQGASENDMVRFDGTHWLPQNAITTNGTDVQVGQHIDIFGICTAAAFAGSGAAITNVNATLLDSLDSTQFLRSDTADTLAGAVTVTADMTFNDLVSLFFGTSSDAYIAWEGGLTLAVDQVVTPGGNITFEDGSTSVHVFELDTGDTYHDGIVHATGGFYVASNPLTTGFNVFQSMTQAAYDAITPDANTIYFING